MNNVRYLLLILLFSCIGNKPIQTHKVKKCQLIDVSDRYNEISDPWLRDKYNYYMKSDSFEYQMLFLRRVEWRENYATAFYISKKSDNEFKLFNINTKSLIVLNDSMRSNLDSIINKVKYGRYFQFCENYSRGGNVYLIALKRKEKLILRCESIIGDYSTLCKSSIEKLKYSIDLFDKLSNLSSNIKISPEIERR